MWLFVLSVLRWSSTPYAQDSCWTSNYLNLELFKITDWSHTSSKAGISSRAIEGNVHHLLSFLSSYWPRTSDTKGMWFCSAFDTSSETTYLDLILEQNHKLKQRLNSPLQLQQSLWTNSMHLIVFLPLTFS